MPSGVYQRKLGWKSPTSFKKGMIPWNKNKKWSEKIKEKMKGKRPHIQGEKNWRWIKDRNWILEKDRLKKSQEWKLWRGEVFERDKYTCQECGASGIYLEPHHIIPIRSDMNNIFNIKNGITLCRPCHIKTIWKESNFVEKYSLLAVA